jgi:hypothetical protein
MEPNPRREIKVKVVINNCFGGYSLSPKAYDYLGLKWDGYGFAFREDRTNPLLIKCVEELGKDADGERAYLSIVEIPNDVEWKIEEYDGDEWVAEKHRVWR